MGKKEYRKCLMCKKKIEYREWTSKKGILKGQKMCSDLMCKGNCRKRFKLLIHLNDVIEELDRL